MPIRIRLGVLFSLAAGLAILAGSFIYLRVLTHELHSTINSGLSIESQAIRTSLTQSRLTAEAAISGTAAFPKDDLAQVFAPDGKLLATSPTAGPHPLLDVAQVRQARRAPITIDPNVRTNSPDPDREHVRIMAAPVALGGGTGVLLVGTSLAPTDDALDRVTDATQWAAPIATVLAGLAAWLLAGAALRPVERMRSQVAAMSSDVPNAFIAEPNTRDEIAALARTMNLLLSRLTDALARERTFVVDAGHELRTPLAVLQAELELAARPGRSLRDLRAAVSAAAEESERLSRLANDLLVLARDNGGGAPIRREPTTMTELLGGAVSSALPRALEGGVAIELVAIKDLVADIDPGRVRRLVDNLVDNAIRHTPPGGVITVTGSAERDRLRISVADTGPGFPSAFLPHAFERFGRADAARARDTGGTGLGLAIVRSIAEAHDGTAKAANASDGGAVVTVELADAILTLHGDRP